MEIAIIKLVWQRGHGEPKKVVDICGRRPQWWTEVKQRWGDAPWFRDLLLTSGERSKPKKRSSPR